MMIVREVEQLTRSYVRKGGKDNRKQQRNRMIVFAEFAATKGANSIGQVGTGHVVDYWKSHRELAPTTAYSHWLAIKALWRLAGKPGEPPRPRGDMPVKGPPQKTEKIAR